MRVLYVAMTRAKDMLIMTDCAAKQPQRLRRLNAALTEPVRPEIAGSVLQMGDWVMMAALCRTEAGELHAQAGGNAVSRVRPDPWRITFQSAQALRAQHSGAAGSFPIFRRRGRSFRSWRRSFRMYIRTWPRQKRPPS